MTTSDDYERFMRDPDMRDSAYHYLAIMADMGVDRGIQKSTDDQAIEVVTKILGDPSDFGTECLAAVIVGALEKHRRDTDAE